MTEFTWAKLIHRYHITTPSFLIICKTEARNNCNCSSYICFSQHLVLLN